MSLNGRDPAGILVSWGVLRGFPSAPPCHHQCGGAGVHPLPLPSHPASNCSEKVASTSQWDPCALTSGIVGFFRAQLLSMGWMYGSRWGVQAEERQSHRGWEGRCRQGSMVGEGWAAAGMLGDFRWPWDRSMVVAMVGQQVWSNRHPVYVGNGHRGRSSVAARCDPWSPNLRRTVLAASSHSSPWLQPAQPTRPPTKPCAQSCGDSSSRTWSHHSPAHCPQASCCPWTEIQAPDQGPPVRLPSCPPAHLWLNLRPCNGQVGKIGGGEGTTGATLWWAGNKALMVGKWKSLTHVWLFATPWTIQTMEFSRPEYWSG